MDIAVWLAFVAASAALLAVPGPVVLLAVTEAAERGFSAVLPLMAGVMIGDALAMGLSLAGAGALLTASAEAFAALKLAGGAYLFWLGVRAFAGQGRTGAKPRRASASFRSAFLVTALHPGGFVFFLSFVPLFIDPERAVWPQFVLLIVTFTALTGLNVALWASLAGAAQEKLRRPRIATRLGTLGGIALGAAGLAAMASAVGSSIRGVRE